MNNRPVPTRQYSGTASSGRAAFAKPKRHSTLFQSAPNPQLIKKGGIGAAVVIILFLLFSLFGGRSDKATINKYVKYQFSGNVKGIVNLMPKKVLKKELESDDSPYDSLDEFIADGEEELEDLMDTLDKYVGDNWKVTHKIVEKEKYSEKELKSIKRDYKKYGVNVRTAEEIEIEVKIEVANNSQTQTMYIPLVKIGNSWYLDVLNLGSLF